MIKLLTTSLVIAMITGVKAQNQNQANYDESKVPKYNLPDVLKTSANAEVKDQTTWEKVRRPEILRLFEDNIYGQMPRTYSGIKYSVTNENVHAMNGKATLKEVLIEVFNNNKSVKIKLILFVPNAVKKPVAIFFILALGVILTTLETLVVGNTPKSPNTFLNKNGSPTIQLK